MEDSMDSPFVYSQRAARPNFIVAQSAPWLSPSSQPETEPSRADDRRFAEIYQREHAFVRSSLKQRGLRAEELEDATQEVFFVMHRRFHDLRLDGPIRPWLRLVSERVYQNHARARRRRWRGLPMEDACELDAIADPAHRSPDREAERGHHRERIRSAVRRLPAEQREVFHLSQIQELPVERIAEMLLLSPHTVRSRLRSARAALRRLLRELSPSWSSSM